MNERNTFDNLAERMVAMGYAASIADVSTTGEYLIADAMWNTMDLRHADKLHPQVAKSTPFFVDHHVCGYVIHVKTLGIAVPIVGMTYLVNESMLGAVLNLPFGILVKSEIECTQDSEIRTTVRVRYTILSHRYLKFTHRLIAWSLRRNFDLLMQDDVPMRERKMELRRLGFDNNQNCRSFLNSMDISRNNIRFDSARAPSVQNRIDVSIRLDEFKADSGTRIELSPEKSYVAFKEDGGISVFPSYCPHEGAQLDGVQCKDGYLICPWHGRKLKPLCRIEKVNEPSARGTAQLLGNLNVTVMNDGGRLRFSAVSN